MAHKTLRLFVLAALALLSLAALAGAVSAQEPWRIDDQLPSRLSLSLQSRLRYESLQDEFRVGTRGDADILVLRTLLHGRFRVNDHLSLGAELEDSRAYLQEIPVGSSIVNTVELLQAYVDLHFGGTGGTGRPFDGRSRVRAGRITVDAGSRRLVARNRFRNTINGFTGIDWRWQGQDERELRAFWLLPVRRRPSNPKKTRDNEVRFDDESLNVQFWGLFAGGRLPGGHRGELYVYGLHEQDENNRPTRNRRLFTPGFRLWKPPEMGHLDYLVESVLQVGKSRASVTSRRDLDHFAFFEHAEAGWSFAAPWSPRLLAQVDYASGDDDPTDGRNGRFDTLFGARRFDFGPTGIYGPFARANLITPGLRLKLRPAKAVSSFVAVRPFWLAEDRDAWVGTGLRDPTGSSGRYLGTQVELRLRFDVLPGNVRIEGGFAHLFAGGFRHDVPGSNGQGSSTYGYVQATLHL